MNSIYHHQYHVHNPLDIVRCTAVKNPIEAVSSAVTQIKSNGIIKFQPNTS